MVQYHEDRAPDRPVGDPQRRLRAAGAVGVQPALQRRAADHRLREAAVGAAARSGSPGLRLFWGLAALGVHGAGSARHPCRAVAARIWTLAPIRDWGPDPMQQPVSAADPLEYSAKHGPGNAQGTNRQRRVRGRPGAVADAILRRLWGLSEAAAQKECSYPDSRPSPSANTTPGVPSTTKPTHVSSPSRLRGREASRASPRSAPARRRTARSPRPRWPRTTGGRRRARPRPRRRRRRAAAPTATARSARRCGAPGGRRRWRARRTGRSSRVRRARRERARRRAAAAGRA